MMSCDGFFVVVVVVGMMMIMMGGAGVFLEAVDTVITRCA